MLREGYTRAYHAPTVLITLGRARVPCVEPARLSFASLRF